MKCGIDDRTLKQIQTSVNSALLSYSRAKSKALKEGLPITELQSELKQKVFDQYKQIQMDYEVNQDNIDSVIKTIQERFDRYQLGEIDRTFFSENQTRDILLNPNLPNLNLLDFSIDNLVDTEQVRIRKDASIAFIDNAFGRANEAKTKFIQDLNQHLFDVLFVNRGSISGQSLGLVTSDAELNSNIRQYQEQLFKKVINYLKVINSQGENVKFQGLKFNQKMSLYIQDGKGLKNSGYFDIVQRQAGEFLSFSNKTAEELRQLYNRSLDISNSQVDKERARMTLEAYSANLILNHFDDYLSYLLGDALKIRNFNQLTGENKYSLSSQTANVVKTWRTDDNINVEQESDKITRLAISTTPIYNWQSNTPKYGQYLSFADYSHLIAKIKDLVYISEVSEIDLNKMLDDSESLQDTLAPETQDFLRSSGNLRIAINQIRKNPRKYTHLLFDVLTNDRFRLNYPNIYKRFTKDELNKLWSLNKGIFGVTQSNSIYNLVPPSVTNDFYANIVQSVDSIFNVNFLQYYRNEDGVIQSRTLLDQGINNLERKLKQSIILGNSIRLVKNPSYFDGFTYKNGLVSFTIPNTNTQVNVNLNSGIVISLNRPRWDTLWQNENFADFIDNILKQNLQNNVALYSALAENSISDLNQQLFETSCRIMAMRYYSYSQIKGKGITGKKEILEEAHRVNPGIRYNNVLSEIEVITEKDIPLISRISTEQANLLGLSTASMVKDGEGNTQSAQTLSRLLGSLQSQWELQERQPDSATRDFTLLKPGVLKGIYTCKEFHDYSGLNKETTSSSVQEMAYSEILLDCVGRLITDNTIALLPSVNSDKSTIGRIIIDALTVINGKTIKESRAQDLHQVIMQELGTYYNRMKAKINQDFDTISAFIGIDVHPDTFKVFNEMNFGGLTPVQYVKAKVREYNQLHRNNPIELIDQVHFINDKGKLKFNPVIDSQIERFKNLEKTQQFFRFQNTSMIIDLLKSNFTLNVGNENQKECVFIKRNYPKWVNASGNLILAKLNGVNITQITDIIKLGFTDPKELYNELLEINPILEKYNLLDYLFTQEFMNTSVGSFVAHPAKIKSNDVLELEAACFQAQHKRNVSMTAAMQEFSLGLLSGIPSDYNIAVVDDILDFQGTLNGVINKIKPFDGATFVNPFIVILENNSLGGAKAGITKKQFVHFKNEKTGTGGIIKTAGFGMTNDWLRNSPLLLNMMRKMTGRVWLDQNGQYYITDITKDYNGNNINYQDIYYEKEGRFYKVTDIQYQGNNEYLKTVVEVTEQGRVIGKEISQIVEINNNYDLWRFFGGMNSLSFNDSGKLQYSNRSVEQVVIAMNSIGNKLSDNVRTQDDLYQPLKHSDIHYIVTAGAVKQGAANINYSSSYADDTPFDFQIIHMLQAGIQLNKEHHADDADLSLMTQVISACAAKGFTFEKASKLYEALSQASTIATKEFQDAMQQLVTENNTNALSEVVIKVIVDNLANSKTNNGNFAQVIAEDLIAEAKKGKKISFKDAIFPLSDNTIYAKVLSIIASYLTNSGIKQKIPGLLSVLTPSFNIMKLYNNQKREYYKNFDKEIAEAQDRVVPVYIRGTETNISNLELGRYYIIERQLPDETYTSEIKLIATPKDYKELKDELGSIVRITESLKEGRDLAAYNIHFSSDYGEHQLWDLDSVQNSFALVDAKTIEDLQKISDDMGYGYVFKDVNSIESYKQELKTRLERSKQQDLLNLSLSSESTLSKYNKLLKTKEDTPEWYMRYTNWLNIILGNKNGNKLILDGQEIILNTSNFDQVDAIVRILLGNQDKVRINKQYVTVDRSSIKVSPYEIIMPKTFKSAYNLDEFASLQTIQGNPDYFIEQYIRNQNTKLNGKLFDIELKCTNGNHYYLAQKKYPSLRLLSNINTVELDGKIYRQDNLNNIMYEITPDTKIYVDRTGVEVIVDPNLEFFLDSLAYDVPKISNNLSGDKLRNILSVLEESNSPLVEKYYKYITSAAKTGEQIQQNSEDYHAIDINDESNPIVKIGRAKYQSFLKSLDIVATRTPSQSMQSFMPMKVVAFDNPDINTAYVSTLQILLQGSDYDIDAVSLATYDVDRNGLLQLWSPYADITNTQQLQKSLKLPIPTGKSVKENGQIPVSDNLGAIQDALTYFKDLFIISPKYLKRGEDYIEADNQLVVELAPNANLTKLTKFLQYYSNNFAVPTEEDMPMFSRWASTHLWKIGVTQNELGQEVPIYKAMNKEQIDSFFQQLARLIDKHNLYFDKMSKSKLSRIVNNIEMNSIYEVILDPVNLIQATTSVDGTTGPLKDEAKKSNKAKDAKYRTPGNFVNKLYSIIENQVGKQAIGICAVGLKTYFGLTQYNNYILNYGTEEEQKRLILGGQGITIGGKTYKTLANIRALNPVTIKNNDILSALAEAGNDYDAALILSALLSLATDNAKELSLSKLNATTKMIGMYTYGLTIGMRFEDIAKVLMSPVGDIICDMLDGNVFTGKREYRRVNDQVFNYFDKGPISVYSIVGDSAEILANKLLKLLDQEKIPHRSSKLHILIKNLAQNERLNLLEKLNLVQSLRFDTVSNKLADFIEKYIYQYNAILENQEDYKDIKTLAKGAYEMFILGQGYSLNQGIKTDQSSFLNQVSNITETFMRAGSTQDIDLAKLTYDNKYRLSLIEAYDVIKGTFNTLDALSTNPHTLSYMKLAATSLKSFSNSFKFRTVHNNLYDAMDKIKTQDKASVVKGLQNYVGDYLRDNWFISRGVKFTIPKGNIDEKGEALKVDTTAELGYKQDNNIFKLWVENEVIPNLKEGKILDSIVVPIKNNAFIQQLTNDLQTNNIDHNPSIVYTLPINMLPRTDEQRNMFNQYKSEFNKLAQYSYKYKTDSGIKSIPLVDLFTYYAMIANNWKQSEISLVSILEDFQNSGVIDDFHKFEDIIDKSGEYVEFTTEMIPYIAPVDNRYSSRKTYIYSSTQEGGKKLMQAYETEDSIRTYSPVSIDENIEKDIFFKTGNNSIVRLTYEPRTKNIKFLGIGLTKLEEVINALNSKIPITKKNGIVQVDIQYLQDLINSALNKC